MNNTLPLNLAIHRMTFLRTTEKLLLSQTFSSLKELLRVSKQEISFLIRRQIRKPMIDASALSRLVEQDIIYLREHDVRPLFYPDVSYPRRLREIYNPPFLLFCRGLLCDPSAETLGIVGTRYPSGCGRKSAFFLASQCGKENISVVSGLARGIDGEAHAGALAGGAHTCAVFGSGIDCLYPADHKKLASDILKKGGALLSEYPPGTPPLRYNFPERNRIISGLCRGVVIMEAPKKSGALITADFALEQGRDVFVHEECIKTEKWEGSYRLVQEGAPVIFNLQNILADWGIQPSSTASSRQTGEEKDAQISLVLSKLLEEELSEEVLFHKGEYIRR